MHEKIYNTILRGIIFISALFTIIVTQAQLVGSNEIRISFTGPDGDDLYDAWDSEVAYNATDNEYFVVWSGDTIAGEDEIWGQRIDATGALVGSAVRISHQGTDGNINPDAFDPDVVWNATDNEYYVVWRGDGDGVIVDNEFEVFGQRISNTGVLVGPLMTQISFCGPTSNANYDITEPEVAWNSTNNTYLVVWSGDSLTDNEDEISGQKVLNDGTLSGSNFHITNSGEGNGFDAEDPSIVYNPIRDEYLIVFQQDYLVSGYDEIFAVIVNGAGTAVTTSEYVISDMDASQTTDRDAYEPHVAWNSDLNQYLAVWHGDGDTLTIQDNEFEIFGQILDSNGMEIGVNDFRITSVGGTNESSYDANDAKVAYSPACQEYKVMFYAGNNESANFVVGENDSFIITVASDGTPGTEERISDAGPQTDANYDAYAGDIVYNPTANEFFITYSMEDTAGALVDGEVEVYGYRYTCTPVCVTTYETISPTACESYMSPAGNAYSTTGMYVDTITNAGGCDSIITINLTINNATSSTISPSACTSYLSPAGNTYSSTGMYMDTIMNAEGCDSVITINLTVGGNATSTISPTSCGSYLSPSGKTYSTSGMYMDTIPSGGGCDSIITINLTVNQPTSSLIAESVCDSYISPSGKTYSTTGMYIDTIANMAGCDSIITINLTVNQSTSSSLTESACEIYLSPAGNTYDSTGTYMDTIANMAGCDSVITIDLTINTTPANTVSQADSTLTADAMGVTYQWIDCGNGNTALSGETDQSFTAASTGSYAVIVSEGSCADTSSCLNVTIEVGIEELELSSVSVYPNPSNGNYTVSGLAGVQYPLLVEVKDLTGRLIQSQTFYGSGLDQIQLNLGEDAKDGMYFVRLVSGSKESVLRISKITR